MLKKLRVLFAKENKNKELGSVFSQRLQQSGYKARHLDTRPRKKSFRERWLPANRAGFLKSGGVAEQKKDGKFLLSLKLMALAGMVLTGCYLLLTGPLLSLYGDYRYFRIHEIEISGCRMISNDELRRYAGLSYEMNMMTLDPKAIRTRLQSHPWIQTASVKRIWPDGLAVSIKEQRPQALVVRNGGQQFSYVNSSGTVFAPVELGQELDYPVITGITLSHTEEEQKKMIAKANLFLRLAERNNPNLPAQDISEIHFTEEGEFVLYLVEYPFPIYFGKGDVARKYVQLRQVLEILYRKKRGGATIKKVAYIRMDYQKNKVLVARTHAG
jgi:cell division protein FtsQ